jgi:hypothetical protein
MSERHGEPAPAPEAGASVASSSRRLPGWVCRIGELLRAMAKTGERKTPETAKIKSDAATRLTDLGITKDESSRYQRLAKAEPEPSAFDRHAFVDGEVKRALQRALLQLGRAREITDHDPTRHALRTIMVVGLVPLIEHVDERAQLAECAARIHDLERIALARSCG